MKCKRKGIILGLAIVVQIYTFQPAMAHENNVPVTLDTEAPMFSVTVPTSLPIWVDTSSQVTTATDAKIINNGVGPILISNVEITPVNGWSLSEYDTDHSKSKVNSKKIGFSLNGDITTSSHLEFDQSNWPSITSKGERLLTYDATLPPQSESIVEEVAQVVFTIGWDHAEDTTEYTPFTISASNRSLIGYTGQPNEDLVIPNKFIGEDGVPYQITSLENYAFKDCTNIRSLVLPDGLKDTGYGTFWGCTSMESVVLPEGLTKVGSGSFRQCSKLKQINLPNSIISIEDSAFYLCRELDSVTIPKNLEVMGAYAFQGCSGITGSITIPSGVKSIGLSAFAICEKLNNITLEDGIEIIGGGAFQSCKALTEFVIPESVTTIEKYAFAYCSNLGSINIPDSVESIGHFAFADLTSLKRLDVPSTVKDIGNNAFRDIIHVYYTGPATGSPWGALAIN